MLKLGRNANKDIAVADKTVEVEAPKPKSVSQIGLPPETRDRITRLLMERVNVEAASEIPHADLLRQIEDGVGQIATEERIRLNAEEQRVLARTIADDMVGTGPLEPLLTDDTVSDILVNGAKNIYVERRGKLELTGEEFRDEDHVRAVAQRIARSIGRRIDDSSPMVDARLPDGSRVNIVFPPVALEGVTISIRRFSRQQITLDHLVRFGSIDEKMRRFMELAARARLNILVSGGTSTGKTTMMNALSRNIDPRERIIVIEDASELQLQQPHVVRLETRPATVDGHHEITMRDLLRNSLRMRPDRIIVGECRQGEAFDMLQAMNTGHDGSMSTLHANTPRDALIRLENMVMMAGFDLPTRAIRVQMANAVDLIIQIERMRDGVRRVTRLTEITGIEGDVIATQDIFAFEVDGNASTEHVVGEYRSSKIRPRCGDKMRIYGLEKQLMQVLHG
ncbi:MAG: CpaF family protein [Alphaproteobacteria bacterium]